MSGYTLFNMFLNIGMAIILDFSHSEETIVNNGNHWRFDVLRYIHLHFSNGENFDIFAAWSYLLQT